ncbi:MAG: GyrI-like domain-containing protein [Thermoleophilia bacterium]
MSERCVKVTDPLVVAVCGYRGPALGVGEAFERVQSWADVHHFEQWGPLIGVYSDAADAAVDAAVDAADHGAAVDAADAAPAVAVGSVDVSAEAWLPLLPGASAPAAADAAIQVRALDPECVASCVHRGFPDGVGEVLAGLLAWVEEEGLARATTTHRQVYLQAPKGRPGDWEIEIQVPVAPRTSEPRPPEPR